MSRTVVFSVDLIRPLSPDLPVYMDGKVKRRSGIGSSVVEESKAKAKARRTVIKSADMAEEMQQDALACTVQAMDEFDVDKV